MPIKKSDSPVRIIGSRELHQNLPAILGGLEDPDVRYVLTVQGKLRTVLVGTEAYLRLIRESKVPSDQLVGVVLGALLGGDLGSISSTKLNREITSKSISAVGGLSPNEASGEAPKTDSPVRIIGSRELHQNLPAILGGLEDPDVRYVLTVHSKPRIVLVGTEAYLRLIRESKVPSDQPVGVLLGALLPTDTPDPVRVQDSDASDLIVYLDPGDAPQDLITEFYLALDALYRAKGGSGLKFVKDENRFLVTEGVS